MPSGFNRNTSGNKEAKPKTTNGDSQDSKGRRKKKRWSDKIK